MSQSTRAASAELVTYAARLTRAVRRGTDPDIPAALHRLLSMLDELGPTTVGELARADRTSQPTATAAVNALVERGWGARTPHPRDARSSLVEMTDTGRAVLAGARREYGAMLADRLPPYTAEDLRTATALIKHLLENHT